MSTRISIIIPVLNEESAIRSCLEHLCSIKDDMCQIIVCDGGSNDNTISAVREFEDCRVCSSFSGRGSQMNEGAKYANGDILVFLHADSFLPARAFALIREGLSDARVIGGFFINEMYGQESESFLFKISAHLLTIRSRISMRPYGDMGIFIRRGVFDKMNGYKNIPIMEDYEFSGRLKREGEIIRIPYSVKTSVRRFRGKLVRTVLMMQIMKLLFNCGVSPNILANWYKNIR